MITIGIFTTSRAEFGLLSNLIDGIILDNDLDYQLFVGGGHHLKDQGHSNNEIIEKKYKHVNFDFLTNSDSKKELTKSLGTELYQLSDIFLDWKFDYVAILGDRIELLPIVQTAIIFRKPIIHLHGGEITEGAWDDQIRHMISKAAHLHFCATEEYGQNIINMGEEKWRVHNVGALGIDTIVKNQSISKEELFTKYSLDLALPTILLTYHPVTLELEITAKSQIENLFSALNGYAFQVIITAPNVDSNHQPIFDIIEKETKLHHNYHFIRSLGINNYQSMLKYVEFVIGNSSSGIIEVPYFRIPTINIGDRQKGRIRHSSVIDTDYTVGLIRDAINKAVDPGFKESIKDMEYKFGDGHATERIIEIIKKNKIDKDILRKKLEYYDG